MFWCSRPGDVLRVPRGQAPLGWLTSRLVVVPEDTNEAGRGPKDGERALSHGMMWARAAWPRFWRTMSQTGLSWFRWSPAGTGAEPESP